jgi:DNA-binding NtrC family response regulator
MIPQKILILEEDRHLQWIWKTFLESKGFSPFVSDKAEKALEIASKREISIFITEYWINQSTTLETIRELKTLFPQIYVLLNTYRVMDENEYQKIKEVGVDDLFEKPFSFEKMMGHLKKGFQKNQLVSRGNGDKRNGLRKPQILTGEEDKL